eukprot:7090368-Karenia_brevis.AAC.1
MPKLEFDASNPYQQEQYYALIRIRHNQTWTYFDILRELQQAALETLPQHKTELERKCLTDETWAKLKELGHE